MNFYFNSFITLILVSFSFSVYQVGDQISPDDQAREFDVCYGAEHHGIEQENGRYNLSFGDYNGYTSDSGVFYVMMIDMAASW